MGDEDGHAAEWDGRVTDATLIGRQIGTNDMKWFPGYQLKEACTIWRLNDYTQSGYLENCLWWEKLLEFNVYMI